MGDQDFRETAARPNYFDVTLVLSGQMILFSFYLFEQVSAYLMLPAITLNAAGLGLGARRTGRKVVPRVLIGIILPVLVPIVALVMMMFKKRGTVDLSQEKPVSMHVHIIFAIAIFLVGAVLMDSASFTIVAVIIAMVWIVSRKKGIYTTERKIKGIAIYILAFAMVLGMKGINNHVAHKNAGMIIAACEKYKERAGRYPAALNDLVPVYLPEVPVARYTMIFSEFKYSKRSADPEDNYFLIYQLEAPYARNVYSSARKGWHEID